MIEQVTVYKVVDEIQLKHLYLVYHTGRILFMKLGFSYIIHAYIERAAQTRTLYACMRKKVTQAQTAYAGQTA